MKYEAYDDGFFPFIFKKGKGSTVIVGVLVNEINNVEKIAWAKTPVDLGFSHQLIKEISGLLDGDLIFLDGVTYVGFDVVDPFKLYKEVRKPIIVFQQYPLDIEKIRKALGKHFANGEKRFEIIEKVYERLIYVDTAWRPVQILNIGIDIETAIEIINKTCIYSPIPEPLRIADKIASAISRIIIGFDTRSYKKL
ncbi:MAG: DUF99 family protein [Desulfurococcaceae archaeon]